MQRPIAAVLFAVLLLEVPLIAGIPGDKSMYVGGTVASLGKEAVGVLTADDPKITSFTSKKGNWQIPHDKIAALSYGQHAGRRVGATVALGITTLGIGALPVLFSKKRRHYLTIEYTDDAGAPQAAIFEVGKNSVRTLLKTLEVRSGKKIEYEDEEARKSGNK